MTFDPSFVTSNFRVPAGASVAATSHESSVLVTAIAPPWSALGSQPVSSSAPPTAMTTATLGLRVLISILGVSLRWLSGGGDGPQVAVRSGAPAVEREREASSGAGPRTRGQAVAAAGAAAGFGAERSPRTKSVPTTMT